MIIDHLAWAFVPMTSFAGEMMHFVGRLTVPIMAFFISEGYAHTRDVKPFYALGVFVIPIILHFYNGEPGKQNTFYEWFFYAFYLAIFNCCI